MSILSSAELCARVWSSLLISEGPNSNSDWFCYRLVTPKYIRCIMVGNFTCPTPRNRLPRLPWQLHVFWKACEWALNLLAFSLRFSSWEPEYMISVNKFSFLWKAHPFSCLPELTTLLSSFSCNIYLASWFLVTDYGWKTVFSLRLGSHLTTVSQWTMSNGPSSGTGSAWQSPHSNLYL